MSAIELNALAAFMLGLMGSPHCLGMCGAISALSSVSSQPRRGSSTWLLPLGFQLGRISSYALIGAIGGGVAAVMAGEFMIVGKSLRVLASVLLIVVAVSLAGWWKGSTIIEAGGAKLWRRLQPLVKRLLPADRLPKALALGGLWGFLPCGLIYSSLAWASTSASAAQSAWLMFCFGLGTLPSMLAVSAAHRSALAWLKRPWIRNLVAVSMIAWALYSASTLFMPHGGASHEGMHGGLHSTAMPEQETSDSAMDGMSPGHHHH